MLGKLKVDSKMIKKPWDIIKMIREELNYHVKDSNVVDLSVYYKKFPLWSKDFGGGLRY
jgi:hypothetical protein